MEKCIFSKGLLSNFLQANNKDKDMIQRGHGIDKHKHSAKISVMNREEKIYESY